MTLTDLVRSLRDNWLQEDVKITILPGGISNHNFLVQDGDKFYKVRIPGKNSDFFSDRDAEIRDLRALQTTDLLWSPNLNPMGVVPGVIDYKPDNKIAVFAFVPGKTAREEDFRNRQVRDTAIKSVKRIHQCGVKFSRVFDVFAETERYVGRLATCRNPVSKQYPLEIFRRFALTLCKELKRDQPRAVPCHNDLLSGNFILSENSVHIVDWELAGMNDPRYEIADFLIEHKNILSERDEEEILNSYFGAQNKSMQRGVDCYKFLADFLWALWATIQHNVSELDFDFERYACDRFEASLEHMEMLKSRYSISP